LITEIFFLTGLHSALNSIFKRLWCWRYRKVENSRECCCWYHLMLFMFKLLHLPLMHVNYNDVKCIWECLITIDNWNINLFTTSLPSKLSADYYKLTFVIEKNINRNARILCVCVVISFDNCRENFLIPTTHMRWYFLLQNPIKIRCAGGNVKATRSA
jgi:hypothetical protein